MKSFASTLVAAGGMIASVNAHGFVTSPPARMPGDAMQEACGMQVYYNQMGDNYGNVQGELQVAATQNDYKEDPCNIWMCKGFKFADNKDNVQSYSAGETVPITVDIRAPHTGYANVSIVKTSTNTMISDILKSWDVYASTSSPIPDGNENFEITMPDVGGECATAGDCVIQWYWNAPDIDQTYESCIDFTMSGSGSGSGAGGANTKVVETSAAATSAAPSTTAAAVTTSAAQAPTTTSAAVESTCACNANEKREATKTVEVTKTVTETVAPTATAASKRNARAHPRDLAMN